MGNTIKMMFQTVNPLTFGCYYTVVEFDQIVLNYFSTVGNIDMLFFNIVHNMGNIYDNVVSLTDLFRYENQENLNWWKNLGYYFGNSLNQIFYKPSDFNPY